MTRRLFDGYPRPAPERGDVVIESVAQSGIMWIWRRHQQRGCTLATSFEHARAQAETHARYQGVDVFYTEDGGATFSLLSRHRLDKFIPPASM